MPNKVINANLLQQLELYKALQISKQVIGKVESLVLAADWSFYIVNQSRGRCYFQSKEITIPRWAIDRQQKFKGYGDWYLAHECAHAEVLESLGMKLAIEINHGPEFMAALKEICPKDFWHFETSYKPRNAFAAGISATQGNDIIKIGNKLHDVDLGDLL